MKKRTEPYVSRKLRLRAAISDELRQQTNNQERYAPMEIQQRIDAAKEECRLRKERREARP